MLLIVTDTNVQYQRCYERNAEVNTAKPAMISLRVALHKDKVDILLLSTIFPALEKDALWCGPSDMYNGLKMLVGQPFNQQSWLDDITDYAVFREVKT